MTKCLEFTLPSGSAGMAAGYTKMGIIKKLNLLVAKNQIEQFKHKTDNYKFYVWLETEHDYTTFFIIWDSSNPWQYPKVIEKDYPSDQSTSSSTTK